MKRIVLSLLACLGILAATGASVFALFLAKPAPKQEPRTERDPVVEVLVVQPETIPLRIPAQGMVQASRVTQLAAEVAGRVTWVAPQFKAGGRFASGEDLIRIDPADYEAALANARAGLSDAELNLVNEEARAEQALRDWKRLGSSLAPSDLTLRKPHLKSAEARIVAAKAAVQEAERKLARTRIQAPFAATIDSIQTELGSYLAPGQPVANVLAGPPYEVRLPLALDDYTLVSSPGGSSAPAVRFRTRAGGVDHAWEGRVIREEGQMERESRSVYLVAEVSPKDRNDRVMQPGLFVQAEVEGNLLRNVFRVPLQAFQGEDQLILIGPGDQVEFRDVSVLRREGDIAMVSQGLNPGERVCLTALDVFIDGMKVDPRPVAAQPPGPLP